MYHFLSDLVNVSSQRLIQSIELIVRNPGEGLIQEAMNKRGPVIAHIAKS